MSELPYQPPNQNDLVAGDIIQCPFYYTYVPGTPAYYTPQNVYVPAVPGYYTNSNYDDILNYSFDDKVSVIGASAGTGYDATVLMGGVDDLLFTGTVDGSFTIPKAMAMECGAFSEAEVIDLSAGPLTYARFLELHAADKKTGDYLLTATGKQFVQDLAQFDRYKSLAMIDIESGVALLKNDVPIRAPYVEIAGGALRVDETLDYDGDMTLVNGSVTIVGNSVATYTGVFNDLGTVRGKGALDVIGGDFNTGVGATVTVNTWLSHGTTTKTAYDYIEGGLTYKGHFIVGGKTDVTFYYSASLTVNKIADIGGKGGIFDMYDGTAVKPRNNTIDVLGKVAKGETFEIGTTDALVLGAPTMFKGIIESLDVGSIATTTEAGVTSGEIFLVGVWNFITDTYNKATNETVLTMKDVSNGLLAHIDFAGAHTASDYTFFDQIKGVTPTTVIAATIT